MQVGNITIKIYNGYQFGTAKYLFSFGDGIIINLII